MAITDAYASVADYQARIGKPSSWATDEARDIVILAQLGSISRYLDRTVGRFFTKDAAAVERIFTREAQDPTLLDVGDLVSVTTIKVDTNDDGVFDEDALSSSDFELLPRNADKGPEPRPFNQILATRTGSQRAWPAGIRIEVSGIFGWPSVPEPILDATVQILAILRTESPLATNRIQELGGFIAASSQARAIVDGLTAMYRSRMFV